MKKFLIACILMLVSFTFSCKAKDTAVPSSSLDGNAPAPYATTTELYPAFQDTPQGKKWGFIDKKGNFTIKPQYDFVTDFNEKGAALVANNQPAPIDFSGQESFSTIHIIDKKGAILSGPYIDDLPYSFTESIVLHKDGTSYCVDSSGKVVFQSATANIHHFAEEMVAFSTVTDGKTLFGYMDLKGNVVIPPTFTYVTPFLKGQAGVTNADGTMSLIDKKGKVLKASIDMFPNAEQSGDKSAEEFTPFRDEQVQLYGYKDKTGKIVISPRFLEAEAFSGGYAVVAEGRNNMISGWGIIDKTGKPVLPADYRCMVNLGGKAFLAGRQSPPTTYSGWAFKGHFPKALVGTDGKIRSEYIYYNYEVLKNGGAYVTDASSTYLLDNKGNIDPAFPKIDGIGQLEYVNGLIKATVGESLAYYSPKGALVWKSAPGNTVDGLVYQTISSHHNVAANVRYPEIQSLKNEVVQEKLNTAIRNLFTKDLPRMLPSSTSLVDKEGIITETLDVGFKLEKNKNLLLLERNGYAYPHGAAHGQPFTDSFVFDLESGNRYTLADLFKRGATYKGKITTLLKADTELRKSLPEPYKDEISVNAVLDQNTAWSIKNSGISLIYPPYSLSSYARGFVHFHIPFGQLISLIDETGSFWNAFDKSVTTRVPYRLHIDGESADKVAQTMNAYETALIEAINSADFQKVSPLLYKDSKLYQAQKVLVDSFGGKGMQTRLEGVEIFAVGFDNETKTTHAFVLEEIGFKNSQSDEFKKTRYRWKYSLKREKGTFQLTDIEKWEAD